MVAVVGGMAAGEAAVGEAAVGVGPALGLPRALSSVPPSQPRLTATVMGRLMAMVMPRPMAMATVTMMTMPMPRLLTATVMPRPTATVMPRPTATVTLGTGIGLATAYLGSDTAATARPVSAMEAPGSAMAGVSVADTCEQDTEESAPVMQEGVSVAATSERDSEEPEQPCMAAAWGGVNLPERPHLPHVRMQGAANNPGPRNNK